MISLSVNSLVETHAVASALAQLSRSGDVIVLAGEMGAGKTAFAQGFGQALGITEPITSPTFTLVHTYDSGRIILHHADLYRLDRLGEVADLGLHEMVEESGVMLVEWGDMAAEILGAHLEVFISRMPDQDDQRTIVLTANGQTWTPRWERVLSAVAPWQVEM